MNEKFMEDLMGMLERIAAALEAIADDIDRVVVRDDDGGDWIVQTSSIPTKRDSA